jgi:hypothetical protein
MKQLSVIKRKKWSPLHMKFINTSCLSFCLGITLLCPSLQAQVSQDVDSQWYLDIPKDYLSQVAVGLSGQSQIQRDQYNVVGDFPATLSGLEMNFKYTVKSLSILSGGMFDLQVLVPSVQMRAQSFHIDTVVEKEVDGTIVRNRLKADCKGILVNSKKPLLIQTRAQMKPAPQVGVESLFLNWSEETDVWELAAESCQGPIGLVPFINTLINKQWLKSTEFRAQIQAELNRQLIDWVQQRSVFGKSFLELKSELVLRWGTFKDTPRTWRISIPASFKTQAACPGLSAGVSPKEQEAPYLTAQPYLFIPDDFVPRVAKCLHRAGMLERKDASFEIAGFQDLLDSWLTKYIVWPDLARFSSKDRFDFVTKSYSDLDLKPVSESKGRRALYLLNTDVVSHMYYKSAKKDIPYVSFSSPLKSYVEVTQAKDLISVGLVGVPVTNLTYRYDLAKSQISDSRIFVGAIEGSVVSELKSKRFTFAMPEFSLSESLGLKAVGFRTVPGGQIWGLKLTKSP